jgi:hypothetical protein
MNKVPAPGRKQIFNSCPKNLDTNAMKSSQVANRIDPEISTKSNFADETFLVVRTIREGNKAIGFTRREMAQLLPEIQRFLWQDNAG